MPRPWSYRSVFPALLCAAALCGACSGSSELGTSTGDGSGHAVLASDEGKASYYHDRFHGRKTASGEVYDKDDHTGAHRSYPFGSVVRVTSLKNGKSVIVRINDRGPHVDARVIDLSRAAAEEIDMIRDGVVNVRLDVLAWER
jgi:rare lipoprotein A